MYENYAKIRDQLGLKDSDVCKRAGISPGTMSDWKSGRYNLKADKLQRIADALGVTVDMIMNEDTYYYDENTAKAAQEIFERPGLRALFDAGRDISDENLYAFADLMTKFKETNPDG